MSILNSFSSGGIRPITGLVRSASVLRPGDVAAGQGAGGGGGGGGDLFDDFESYVTGSLPTEWGTEYGDHVWTVESYNSSNRLRANGVSLWGLCFWDEAGSVEDFDLTFQTNISGDSNSSGIAVRAEKGEYDTSDRYQVWTSPGQNKVSLGKKVSGVWTTLTDYPVSVSSGTWYFIRFQIIGTAIKIGFGTTRALAHASWIIELTDSSLSAGNIAALFYWGNPGAGYFDDFELSIL